MKVTCIFNLSYWFCESTVINCCHGYTQPCVYHTNMFILVNVNAMKVYLNC
uniref:Uncharacterized protein n=1 Tax=Anguilla anguilla TaxID=7936 RepID=A0A0E9RRJ3_ANGAN